jgi:predicted PurR-regulated permease PerM
MPESEKVQHYFFLGLLVSVIALNVIIFYPYLGSLVFAMTLAVVCGPWHRRVIKWLPNLPNLACLITLILVSIIIFVPLTFFGMMVFNQAQGLYISLANNADTARFFNTFLASLSQDLPIGEPVSALITNLNEYTKLFLQYIVSNATVFFASATNVGIQILLILLSMFFFLRDGEKLKEVIIHLSPLRKSDDELIFDYLDKAVNSIVKGALLLSLIQGVIAGIGFLIFGVPNAALFGALTFISSFIPGFGSALVLIPMAGYLYATSSMSAALGMLLWGVLVGVVDNFIRPKIISSGTGMHPLLVLLSILGGISIFGIYGLLMGPLLLSFLFALTDLYKKGIA